MARQAGGSRPSLGLHGQVALFDAAPEALPTLRGRVRVVADLDLTSLHDVPGMRTEEPAQALADLYEREGPHGVRHLRAGFAVLVWDEEKRILVLAVDHVGIRRLYYAVDGRQASFASRASALLAVPGVDGSVNPTVVFQYLNFGYVPAPASIHRGIHRVPPGHLVTISDRGVVLEKYWDVTFTEARVAPVTAAAEIYRRTEQSVARLISSAPIKETGAFLSGGTDSSTVVGLMTRLTGERINAFSIGFGEKRYDELGYAEVTARHFGAALHSHTIAPAEALQVLPCLVESYDEPFGNDSAIGTFCCARLAEQCGMKRLLAGDGGDEIFGGNERYRTDAIFARYHRIPSVLRQTMVEPLLRALPGSDGSLVDWARRYVHRANIPNPYRFYSYGFFFMHEGAELLAPDFLAAAGQAAPHDVVDGHWRHAAADAELNRLLYLDLKLTIGDNDLHKVNRTAELAGVQVAFPMLDLPLVEFMATLPARYKVRGLDKRYLFKRAFSELLAPATLNKRKHGFGVPVSVWLRENRGFADLARDTLLAASARIRPWFRPGALEHLFRLHAGDVTPYYGSILWTVLMLELWHRHHASAGSRQ